MMPTSAGLYELIDQLYDGGAKGGWDTAVQTATRLFDAERGVVAVHDMRQLTPMATAWAGVEPCYRQSYAPSYMQPDMKAIALQVVGQGRPIEVVTDEFQAAYPATYRTHFYNEWLRPQAMQRQLLVQGAPWPAGWGVLFLSRPATARAFDADDVTAMRLLHPHLMRALQVRRRLASAELAREQALGALDRLDLGVVLVGADGRIQHANRAAARLLTAGDGIVARRCAIGCERAEESRALQDLVRDAADPTPVPGEGMLAVRRRSGKRPLSVLVARLGGGTEALGVAAAAILLISDPERTAPAGIADLKRLYGMTDAEARIALALLDADRLADIAERFGISLATVRTLLQRAFAKTETHRQAELVRLLMAHGHLAAPGWVEGAAAGGG